LSPLAPGVGELERIRSAPIAVVHLGFRASDFPRPPRGFGALDGDGSLGLLGVLFVSSLFAGKAPEGRVLLTCLMGGVLRPEALRSDDATLALQCRDDLRRLMGVTAEPEFQRVARWEEAVPQPEVGHRALLGRVALALAGLPPLELAGAAYDGVSVEQVLESGERAAARLLGRLRIGPSTARVVEPVGAPDLDSLPDASGQSRREV
jgi:oxygen-dependent protoporphyrinogen oxidase